MYVCKDIFYACWIFSVSEYNLLLILLLWGVSGRGEQVGGTGLQGIICFKSHISKDISPFLNYVGGKSLQSFTLRSLTLGTNLWSASELSIYSPC